MAKKKRKVTTVEEIDPADEAAAHEDDLAPDPLAAVLDEFEDVASFTLFRLPQPGKPGKRAFLYSGPLDDLGGASVVEFAADRYGGGRYLVSFRADQGMVRKNVGFEVDQAVRPRPQPQADEPRGNGNQSEIVGLLREVLAQRGQPADMTTAIVQAASQQAAALLGVIQPLIGQLMQNTAPQKPPWELIVPVVQGAMEIASEARSGSEESWVGQVDGWLSKLAKISDNERGRRLPLPRPAAPVAPVSEGHLDVPPEPVAVNPNEPGWVKGLRPYLPQIVAWAASDTPPEFVLDTLERVAPRMLDWLAARDPETWPGELVAFVPELAAHRAWIGRLLAALGEEGEGDAPSPAGEPN